MYSHSNPEPSMDSLLPNAYQFYLDPSFPQVDFSDLPDFAQISPNTFQLDHEPPAKRRTRMRAAKACIACRSRHMKCDSIEPECTRCQIDRKTCVYTKSRRGGSHKIYPAKESPRTTDTTGSSTSSSGRTPGLDVDLSSVESRLSVPAIDTFMLEGTRAANWPTNRREDLVTHFFDYFHPGHPIALPQAYLGARRAKDPSSLESLCPTIEYIGSLYEPTAESSNYEQTAVEVLNSTSLPVNGFSVQALILFALAKHCSDEYDIADFYIDKAVDLALSIGMDRKSFATQNGENDAVLEESWRRTWWQLYMTDAIFAAVQHRPTHKLQNISFEVDLPCEDWDYEDGKIPFPPKNFGDYDSREFFDEEVVFSSLTYLIDAIRIASSNFSASIGPFSPGGDAIAAADAKFLNWFLYLPKCKQEAVRHNGQVDEIMFLALVSINSEKLALHRPHSALMFSDIEERSKCTPPENMRKRREQGRSLALHTAKALEATSAIIMMFALPSHMLKHSPLVLCPLGVAVMAQVSACNHVLKLSNHPAMGKQIQRTDSYEIGRDKVRLGLGALKGAASAWGLGRRSTKEVVGVSRELLTREVAIPRVADSDSSGDSTGETSD